ncbi:MAG: leucyl aminopeptidase [Streptosporangiaceae bacterium]
MTVTLESSQAPVSDVTADAIIIGVARGPDGPEPAPGAEDVNRALGGGLAGTLAALGATGRAGEVTKIASGGQLSIPLVVAVGIGPADGPAADAETLRQAAGTGVRSLLRGQPRRIALALPARDPAEAEAVALGALLGGYVFGRYRTGYRDQADGLHAPAGLTLLTADPGGAAAARRAQILADAVTLVRDLVNTSPAHLYPETFAAEAERVARDAGLQVEVTDDKALADEGYGGITGVGQGSVHPPRLVRLAYTSPAATATVVLVGKGITFDSGGLSLKPPKSMETMKSDMGGAAAVLAALQAIAALRPEVNVVGYLPLAENMPGGRAQRPSDVITIYGGKTVEVLNTDAEGRLVMADALSRGAADDPALMIDVATLTGAQLVALGPRIFGVMANDDAVRDSVVAAARRAGEAAWPMPLPEELRKGLDSAVADVANVAGDRNGGMLVAGLFLREFVPAGTRWAHLDIAGPSFHEGEPYGYTAAGGTGAAVRTLVQVALDVADGRR